MAAGCTPHSAKSPCRGGKNLLYYKVPLALDLQWRWVGRHPRRSRGLDPPRSASGILLAHGKDLLKYAAEKPAN